jgi:hypothetical protein
VTEAKNATSFNGTQVFQVNATNASAYYINYTVSKNESTMADVLNATLTLQDFNISSWNLTDGSQGLWLGVELNNNTRNDSDTIICKYEFTNTTNDTFKCIDGKWLPDGSNFTEDAQ